MAYPELRLITSADAIRACYPIMRQLRPHLGIDDFLARVDRMSNSAGYKLACATDTEVKAVAGFRISEWLHTGRYLEVEELVSAEGERSKGYGGALFDWLVIYAREQQCQQVRPVSGVNRLDAHRFYQRKGMQYEAKYFSLDL